MVCPRAGGAGTHVFRSGKRFGGAPDLSGDPPPVEAYRGRSGEPGRGVARVPSSPASQAPLGLQQPLAGGDDRIGHRSAPFPAAPGDPSGRRDPPVGKGGGPSPGGIPPGGGNVCGAPGVPHSDAGRRAGTRPGSRRVFRHGRGGLPGLASGAQAPQLSGAHAGVAGGMDLRAPGAFGGRGDASGGGGRPGAHGKGREGGGACFERKPGMVSGELPRVGALRGGSPGPAFHGRPRPARGGVGRQRQRQDRAPQAPRGGGGVGGNSLGGFRQRRRSGPAGRPLARSPRSMGPRGCPPGGTVFRESGGSDLDPGLHLGTPLHPAISPRFLRSAGRP